MSIEYRLIAEDELQAASEVQSLAFGGHFEPSRLPLVREWFELGDYLGAFDGPDPVGMTLCFPFDMSVPGGSVTAACIDGVSVLPSHRRRGLLTGMMERQLAAAHERGLPISALRSSEAPIYGRFGYGIAAEHEDWKIERHRTAFRREYPWGGSLRMVKTERAREVFPQVYGRAAARRAGAIQPPNPWWDDLMGVTSDGKSGQSANFYIEYREDEVEGCAIYRIKEGTVTVWLLLASTQAASAALWRYCFDIDLIRTIKVWNRPIDDPLVWMLRDPRALRRRPQDWTWLRLIDVSKALSSRTYAVDGEIVLEVRDDFCPWNDGVYELAGGPAGAVCRQTTRKADLVLSVDDLAVPYLGGAALSPLALAGRVEERTPGALSRADAMFATQLKPWSPMIT